MANNNSAMYTLVTLDDSCTNINGIIYKIAYVNWKASNLQDIATARTSFMVLKRRQMGFDIVFCPNECKSDFKAKELCEDYINSIKKDNDEKLRKD